MTRIIAKTSARWGSSFAVIAALCLGVACFAVATFPFIGAAQAQPLKIELQQRPVRLLDRRLVTAHGSDLRFVSDLVAAHPVLLSFTFTGCLQLCPPNDVIMDLVAQQLATAGSKRVKIVTITLDPLTDTPALMRAKLVDAMHRDRLFLSGDPNDVWAVLDGLNVRAGVAQDHDIQFLLIGSGGRYVRAITGLPDPEALVAALATID